MKCTVYEKLIQGVRSLPDISDVLECSYDWRDSILNSCAVVAGMISAKVCQDAAKPPNAADPKLFILAHSLGGLVVKAAVAGGMIHPGRIDRLVFIGCPQLGSPAAFRSMYSDVDLPFFAQVTSLFRTLGKQQFKTHLLHSFRTFPSLSELLPEQSINYLYYSVVSRANPLSERYMDETRRAGALAAQAVFVKADRIIQDARVPTFAIYTATSSEFQTDHDYVVRGVDRPAGYDIEKVYHLDWDGDGTVPEYSAKGGEFCQRLPVVNCKHATMCESDAVFDRIVVAVPAGKTAKPQA
ncbi:MAG TPA: hypothetical protein VGR73_20425 [Bryobacteraceae bacterium]|nr:hypothetical protein [Bryobacteraceae bacterium]